MSVQSEIDRLNAAKTSLAAAKQIGVWRYLAMPGWRICCSGRQHQNRRHTSGDYGWYRECLRLRLRVSMGADGGADAGYYPAHIKHISSSR